MSVQLRTLVDVIRQHATRQPDAIAMICEGRRTDYATLHRVTNQVAQGIRAAGVGQGDRIAYLGKESEHYYELLFGAAKMRRGAGADQLAARRRRGGSHPA